MELLQELFFTAVTALLFSFLIAKLVSAATSPDSPHVTATPSKSVAVDERDAAGEYVVVEEELKEFGERLEVVRGSRSEKREEELVEEVVETVEKFVREPEAVEEVAGTINGSDDEQVVEKQVSELPWKLVEEVELEEQKSEGILENKEEEIESKKSEELGSRLAAEGEAIEQSEEVVVLEKKGEFDDDVEGEKVNTPAEEIGEEKTAIDDDDDDWEGVERSELEKAFAEATKFVESGEKSERLLGSVGSDVQMELYGLHKVATEGPCRQQPPMPLMLSSRAKCDGEHWLRYARNAWQKLGNMSPDVAMEKYIALVSDKVPGWMEDKPTGDGELGSSDSSNYATKDPDLSITSSDQADIADKRNLEQKPVGEINDLCPDSTLENKAKE